MSTNSSDIDQGAPVLTFDQLTTLRKYQNEVGPHGESFLPASDLLQGIHSAYHDTVRDFYWGITEQLEHLGALMIINQDGHQRGEWPRVFLDHRVTPAVRR